MATKPPHRKLTNREAYCRIAAALSLLPFSASTSSPCSPSLFTERPSSELAAPPLCVAHGVAAGGALACRPLKGSSPVARPNGGGVRGPVLVLLRCAHGAARVAPLAGSQMVPLADVVGLPSSRAYSALTYRALALLLVRAWYNIRCIVTSSKSNHNWSLRRSATQQKWCQGASRHAKCAPTPHSAL